MSGFGGKVVISVNPVLCALMDLATFDVLKLVMHGFGVHPHYSSMSHVHVLHKVKLGHAQ